MLIDNHLNWQGFGLGVPSLKLSAEIRQLARVRPSLALIPFLIDWALILLASASVFYLGFGLLPLALIIIGSRQRALSNIVHDGSHGNLIRWRKLNDFLADGLGALPMFDTVRSYRQSHWLHHRHLGLLQDPDSQTHLRYGYDDRKPTHEFAGRTYLKLVLNWLSWKDSIFGNLFALNKQEIAVIALWWFAAVALTSIFWSPARILTLISLWMLSRATSYHAIRIFAEFLDHSGLPTGSVAGFSRNLPHRGLIRFVTHPHQDSYHLTHHLVPNIPHYRLPEAHHLLYQVPAYREAHHCDGYFKGKHTAANCWMGRCRKGEVL